MKVDESTLVGNFGSELASTLNHEGLLVTMAFSDTSLGCLLKLSIQAFHYGGDCLRMRTPRKLPRKQRHGPPLKSLSQFSAIGVRNMYVSQAAPEGVCWFVPVIPVQEG